MGKKNHKRKNTQGGNPHLGPGENLVRQAPPTENPVDLLMNKAQTAYPTLVRQGKRSAVDGHPPTKRQATEAAVLGDKTPFQIILGLAFKAFKMVHHINILIQPIPPKAFKKKVSDLSDFPQPAIPTESLRKELHEIAEEWGRNTTQQMIHHYFGQLFSAMEDIHLTEIPKDDLAQALTIALKRMNSRYKNKLLNSTKEFLDHIMAFLYHSRDHIDQQGRESLREEINQGRDNFPNPPPPGPIPDQEPDQPQGVIADPVHPQGFPCSTAMEIEFGDFSDITGLDKITTSPQPSTSRANIPMTNRFSALSSDESDMEVEEDDTPQPPKYVIPQKRSVKLHTPQKKPKGYSVIRTPSKKSKPQPQPGQSGTISPERPHVPTGHQINGQRQSQASPNQLQPGQHGSIPSGTPQVSPGLRAKRPGQQQVGRGNPNPSNPSPAHTRSGRAYNRNGNGGPARVQVHRASSPQLKEQWQVELQGDPNTLFLGTSNLSRVTHTPDRDYEIHSFPGGKFHHMANLLERSATHQGPKQVIIAMGVNDANSKARTSDIKAQVTKTAQLARERFPSAKIHLAEINHSNQSPNHLIRRIQEINRFIRETEGTETIPQLPPNRVHLDPRDSCTPKVHWTATTANEILSHWSSHLN